MPSRGHVDDTDAQLYRVVARNLASDHAWLSLRYLPHVHPEFREHLPFPFWPEALALRAFGESGLFILGSFYSLATLALVGWIAQSLGGGFAGAIGICTLATTESFFLLGGTARLEPPLMLFATLSAVPLLLPDLRRRGIWLGIAAAAIAVAVKGPFGVVPWSAASVARSLVERRLRPLLIGAGGALLAVAPAAVFLLNDHWHGDGTWWRGYVETQLLASMVGTRTDGSRAFWYPLALVQGRFWPGFPLCVLGVALIGGNLKRGRRDRSLMMVGLTCGFMLLFLMLPGRKSPNHAYVAFPLLSVFGALALRTLLPRDAGRPLHWTGRVAAALSLCLLLAVPLGAGRLWKPRCVAAGPLGPVLDALPEGTELAIASATPSWGTISSLAAERRLLPAPVTTLREVEPNVRWVLASPVLASPPPGWAILSSAGGWTALERSNPHLVPLAGPGSSGGP